MVYKIRLKARQKQAESSTILLLSFFVIVLTSFSLNLIPLVYNVALKPSYAIDNISSIIMSGFLLVTTVVICSALSLGCDRFMLKRAGNSAAGAGDIFYYFSLSRLLSMCGFYGVFISLKTVIFALLSLPCVTCGVILYSLCISGFSAAVCCIFAVFTILFLLLAVVTFLRIGDTYFLVRYRYIKGDYLNFRQLLCDSQNSMMSEIKRLRRMKLSFWGWFLVCLFIVPIPYVWSYYRQSKACFAAEL